MRFTVFHLSSVTNDTGGLRFIFTVDGNRVQIKRRLFERYIDSTDVI